MDNPCLSRSLIADFTNSRCYKQTSTTVNYSYFWTLLEINTWASCVGSDCISCDSSSYGATQNMNYHYNSALFKCDRSISSYSCPITYPFKVSNSICEYIEAF